MLKKNGLAPSTPDPKGIQSLTQFMALQPGTRLGSFEVLVPLGAGGMGEVYRARDTRLGRDVAIKVLPVSFTKDPARAARFEREARMLAAINHPGIAAIYGAEEFDSIPCIVMELVPGETLSERIARGPMPLEEACDLARQIAEALEAAHEKGVIHRDLKPSNIKVTPEGKIKVLDLGLAKVTALQPSGEDLSKAPTQTLEETRPGTILGTVEFMSPEQARGREVDKRTDIWAFGCILFEMLSGRRAFKGETAADVFAAILSAEPDWSALPVSTPPRLRELLSRCLQKDPNKRLRDIGDARIEIERISPQEEEKAAVASLPRNWILVSAVLVLLAAAGVWLGIRVGRQRAAASPALRHMVVLPFVDLTGTQEGQLIGDGFVELVSARLSRIPDLQVVAPSASIAAADRQKDPIRVAKSVGAELALKGTFQREGDRMRITYSVLRAPEGVQITGDDVTGSANDLFSLQDQLTEKVAAGLNLNTRKERLPAPSGLDTSSQQERYVRALGNLQRYDKETSVDEAIRLLEALASEKPASALVHAALGRAYLYKYNLARGKSWADRALVSAERARQLDARLPEANVTLGELFVRTGRGKEAITAFQSALAGQPNSYEALLGLARAEEAAGDAPQAEEAYRRAIQLQPGYFAGYSKFAAFYFNRGEPAKAAEMFRRVTELAPDNARAFGNLGAAYFQIGNLDKAVAAFGKSLELEPTALAYSNLGTTEYFRGHYRDSAEMLERAVRLTPDHFQPWANLGDAYRWTKGETQKARAAYARAISLSREELRVNPRDALVHSILAVCLAKTGELAQAEEHARQAIALDAKNPACLYNAAIVANLAGKTKEALQLLRDAVSARYAPTNIARDPELNNLRKEKEFQDLLQSEPKGF